ncbi:hypothetical protein [Halosimplex halophilum]|uniref:hypothetical protein n=1 Tax=Halosimplex halophilum TaxID=2559572 RepID=UPI00107F8047|nr:hypothetical protein [Halosimplex halophilum]
MTLRPIVALNLAVLVAGPVLFAAVWRFRGGVAAWKRPLAAGTYLVALSATVLELTDATAVASYPRLALALDVGAGVAALAGIVLIGRCWRMRRSDGSESAA